LLLLSLGQWIGLKPLQGTHERDVLMIFDEASAIPDPIWETAEGAMTTPGAIWIAFGTQPRIQGGSGNVGEVQASVEDLSGRLSNGKDGREGAD